MFTLMMVPVDLEHLEPLSKALSAAAGLAKHYEIPVCYVGVANVEPSRIAHNPAEYEKKLQAFTTNQTAKYGHSASCKTLSAMILLLTWMMSCSRQSVQSRRIWWLWHHTCRQSLTTSGPPTAAKLLLIQRHRSLLSGNPRDFAHGTCEAECRQVTTGNTPVAHWDASVQWWSIR